MTEYDPDAAYIGKCKTCRFYDRGHCRRYPPPKAYLGSGAWCAVEWDDWCGEWRGWCDGVPSGHHRGMDNGPGTEVRCFNCGVAMGQSPGVQP